ncbi:hypothetical protein RI138_08340 [Streptomyces sp. C11-1]|uniref:PH domain-containing protein n=1 Tax=Streptomyces durocortorensis TaxID=2811104 RepID=A0ABY9VW49_9ACTN|nr:hypothetical protein [Streptomyces durocortorensis]WNF26845.1 hypothetical protein RI138_08340 [Streptomyces durocortorensis]
MAFIAAAAADLASSGDARGPLSGVAAALGTIALTRRIGAARVVLGKSELKIVNPIFTYRVPYRLVTEVNTSEDGTLTVHTSDGVEINATAFGGSLLDHYFRTSDRAVTRVQEIVRQRRGPRKDDDRSRRAITVSWIADICLLGTVCVAVAALLTPG